MEYVDQFEELNKKCQELSIAIDNELDTKKSIQLKKQFHETKLEMIRIISQEEETQRGVTARTLINDVKNRPKVPRYATGLIGLDEALNGGLEVGTLIQLAGQSFAGKTHFVLEVLSNIAGYSQAVFFNFEMGDARIAHRLDRLLQTDAQLDHLIVDSRTRDLDDLVNEIKIYAKNGVKFFAIDSKMKITSSEKDDFKRFGEITAKLARVSQEYDVIIFLINQMSESDMKDKRLAFKGSGDQMYDTDIALFLMVDKDGTRTLVCNKNRQDENSFTLKVIMEEMSKKLILTRN